MKKMKTKNKCLVTCMAIIAMLMMSLGVKAQQRVHIGLDNGNLLNAYSGTTPDTGTGFSAMWRHEQLALTVTGTDRDGWNADGTSVRMHSTVFGKHTINGKDYMTIVGGRRPSFIVVSLPKGYRILSYKIELVNDLAPNDYYNERIAAGDKIQERFKIINSNSQQDDGELGQGNNAMGNDGEGIMRFYEVARWGTDNTNSPITQNNYSATHCKYINPGSFTNNGGRIGSQGLKEGQAPYYIAQALNGDDGDILSNDRDPNKVYTISRTAQQIGEDDNHVPVYDMGNELYFRLVKNYHCYGLTIKSFEITFNAEGTFAADVVPDAVGEACSVVGAPFPTNKVDIGPMQVEDKDGIEVFSYRYQNVQGLTGYNYLYQEGAVPTTGANAGVPVEDNVAAANKHIHPVQVTVNGNRQLLYALGSDTYYIEPPVEIETNTVVNGQNLKAPIGFRIVGALFTPLWGQRDVDGYTRGAYKLKIWKHDGSEVLRTVEIDGADDPDLNKVYDVGLCNNDAIKFQIETTATNTQALVHVKLLLQALDPYIEKMDIECTDKEHGVLKLRQSFTADDFSVSGGKFIFYVPEDYRNDVLKFTFSDLYTQYGDETYYGGSIGTSRYSYVTSDYFKKYSGNQNADGEDYGFPVNGGLYSNLYKEGNPTANPPIPAGPDYPYDTKVYTSTAGNIRFEFNNAEELAKQAEQAGTGVQLTGNLIEYPFTVSDYIGSTDPDFDPEEAEEGETAKTGLFEPCELMANPTVGYQNTGTFFVFTADETRWNIAPTNNWQHRFYAFYRMEIEAVAKSFLPTFEWTKIYDKTCYYGGEDEEGKVIDLEDSMWGVKLGAADCDNLSVPLPEGYLTYQEIINYMLYDHEATKYTAQQAAAYNEEHNLSEGQTGYKKENDPRTPFIGKQMDPTNTNAPKYMSQILYVDGSDLYAMVNSSTNQTDTEGRLIVITLDDLKDSLSINNLVFLPEGTIEKVDNAAYKIASGFQAGKDIVLTDKKPFFSPYDISVGADNVATYTRLITVPQNGKVTNATVMLPFTLRLENGKHTNLDDNFTFTVNTMNSSKMQDMTPQGDSYFDYGTAYFAAIGKAEEEGQTNITWTKANVPYMINVIPDDNTSGGKISFVATQKGSDIVATPKVGTAGMKEMVGESASGSFGGNTYNFTNYGSYSGVKYDRVVSEDIFYFANNMYLNLHTLNPSKQYLYSYPFRAVYKYATSSSSGTGTTGGGTTGGGGAKLMRGFDISYDDIIPFSGIATDIAAQDTQADLIVKVGRGSVTMTASRAQDVNINTLNGMNMKRVDLNAGDTKTVNLPAGIYVINNVKVIVK